MKTKFLVIAVVLSSISSFGQQDAQYTQYMYNTINVNPAYAGNAVQFGAIYSKADLRNKWNHQHSGTV
jgi:hypothetical protein